MTGHNGAGRQQGGSDDSAARDGGTARTAATPAGTPLSAPAPEAHARTLAQVLGEIVWLMSQSAIHRQLFISDLEWMVMTPVLLGQFRLYYGEGPRAAGPGSATGQQTAQGSSATASSGQSTEPASSAGGQPPMQAQPIGVVLWGLVSAEVEARLASGQSRMRPQDWRSGDRPFVVEVIAPFGGADAMLADLKTKVFAGRAARACRRVGGKAQVVEI